MAVALVLVGHRVAVSPTGIVVRQDARAPWIMADVPVTAMLQQWGRAEAPVVGFSTRFEVAQPAAPARLAVRAFGDVRVLLNGAPVALESDGASWKRFRHAEVGALLLRGSNSLRADVANRRGPPLLALRLEAPGLELATGPHWIAIEEDGTARRTVLANDARRHPSAYRSEAPFDAVVRMAGPLALLFGVPATLFALARKRLAASTGTRLPLAAGLGVAGYWVLLFFLELVDLPLDVGFDAGNHLDYVRLLRRDGRLPLATEHWSAYHPPLFYALSAGLEWLAEALRAGRSHPLAMKLVPFLAGLGNVALAAGLVRRLLPGDAAARTLAILFAGFLPVNLWVAAYFSNEGLHAFLAGLGLLLAVRLLLADEVSSAGAAGLSLVLGLALLTKFTALLVAGPTLLFVATRILVTNRGNPTAAAARLAALVTPLLAVAGWFYARNVIEYGQPLVGNWNLPDSRRVWWSPPGFHTPGYWLRFGEVLVRPYFSGFVSFWDALYSTFWGDGFVAGRAGVQWRHPAWNYTAMAAGYALALPATALLVAGYLRVLGAAWRDPDGRRRAAFGLVALVAAVTGFAVFWATLALPYHGQARASYALALAPVFALCFAWATRGLDAFLGGRGWIAARAVLVGWLGALFGTFALSFAG